MNEPAIQKLNLGSGALKKEGFINVDWQAATKPDIMHNLNVFSYPFLDDRFEYIEAAHVLEHLDRPFLVMKELHRILKPNGRMVIKVPHFSRGFTHAEHAHGFDVTFPLYFNQDFTKSGFYGVAFSLEKMELHWLAFFHLLPSIGYGNFTICFLKILNRIISFFANLSPTFTSRIWCYWVGGFDELEFEFRCVK